MSEVPHVHAEIFTFKPSRSSPIDHPAAKVKPPVVPIKSLKALEETGSVVSVAVPALMTTKALSILTTKALLGSPPVAISGVLAGVNAPLAIYQTYSLAKRWTTLSHKERSTRSAATLAAYSLAASGSATLVAKLPALSALVGKGGTLAAGKVGMVLGPVGLGLLAAVNLSHAGFTVKKAIAYSKQQQQVAEVQKQKTSPLVASILSRQQSVLMRKTRFAIADAAKYLLLGLGLALGAVAMAGVIAMPIGWAALGLVTTGLVVSIGALIAKRRLAITEEREKTRLVQHELETAEVTNKKELEAALAPYITESSLLSALLNEYEEHIA